LSVDVGPTERGTTHGEQKVYREKELSIDEEPESAGHGSGVSGGGSDTIDDEFRHPQGGDGDYGAEDAEGKVGADEPGAGVPDEGGGGGHRAEGGDAVAPRIPFLPDLGGYGAGHV